MTTSVSPSKTKKSLRDPAHHWFVRFLPWGVLLLAALSFPLYAVKVYQKSNYSDFLVYYRAATRSLLHQWNEVYTLIDGTSPFRYAPPTLLFFELLAHLSLDSARLTWFILQYLWFSLGFFFLFKTLEALKPKRPILSSPTSPQASKSLLTHTSPAFLTSLSFLFILRFCLDTWMIGQISSLMFLGLSIGLYGFVIQKNVLSAVGLFIPSFLKIGPGILLCSYLTTPLTARIRVGVTWFLLLFLLSILCWMKFEDSTLNLWSGWLNMIAQDSNYYDASHYGSQSLRSFLLRTVRDFSLSKSIIQPIYLLFAVCVNLPYLWLCGSRTPSSPLGRGLFFTYGLFINLWLMPESFKYSFTPLALPFALLLAAPHLTWVDRLGMGLSALILSCSGMDIVGEPLFFAIQLHSLPFLVTLILGAIVFKHVKKESLSHSPFQVQKRFPLSPWKVLPLPLDKRAFDYSILIPVSKADLKRVPHFTAHLNQVFSFFTNYSKASQVFLLPFGENSSFIEQSLSQLPFSLPPQAQVLESSDTYGEALREGFLKAAGFRFWVISPYLQIEELAKVISNDDLQSHWILHSLRTFGFSLRFGKDVFSLQHYTDLRFIAEMACVHRSHPYTAGSVFAKKGFVRKVIFEQNECPLIPLLFFTPTFLLLVIRFLRGFYDPLRSLPKRVTADDWGISPGVNQGILELAQKGVVRRVSIMANTPYVDHLLKELCDLPNIELGLHFNLTQGRSLRTQPLSSTKQASFFEKNQTPPHNHYISSPAKFMIKWHLEQLIALIEKPSPGVSHVKEELESQLRRLQFLNIPLKYLDGHHHIHLVPGIITHLAPDLQKAGISQVRLPYHRSFWWSRKLPIAILSLLAKPKLKKHGFSSAPFIYPTSRHFKDPGRLRSLLKKHVDYEIIVHPASFSDFEELKISDPYREERVTEFHTLRMVGFTE